MARGTVRGPARSPSGQPVDTLPASGSTRPSATRPSSARARCTGSSQTASSARLRHRVRRPRAARRAACRAPAGRCPRRSGRGAAGPSCGGLAGQPPRARRGDRAASALRRAGRAHQRAQLHGRRRPARRGRLVLRAAARRASRRSAAVVAVGGYCDAGHQPGRRPGARWCPAPRAAARTRTRRPPPPVYSPTPGQRQQLARARAGTSPPCRSVIAGRRAVQPQRPARVAEPAPGPDRLAGRLGGQVGRARPAGQPLLVHRQHPAHRGLLEHELADHHAPGARLRAAPRQVAGVAANQSRSMRGACRAVGAARMSQSWRRRSWHSGGAAGRRTPDTATVRGDRRDRGKVGVPAAGGATGAPVISPRVCAWARAQSRRTPAVLHLLAAAGSCAVPARRRARRRRLGAGARRRLRRKRNGHRHAGAHGTGRQHPAARRCPPGHPGGPTAPAQHRRSTGGAPAARSVGGTGDSGRRRPAARPATAPPARPAGRPAAPRTAPAAGGVSAAAAPGRPDLPTAHRHVQLALHSVKNSYEPGEKPKFAALGRQLRRRLVQGGLLGRRPRW